MHERDQELIESSEKVDLQRREQLLELCEIAKSGLGTSQFTHARAALQAIYEKSHKYASMMVILEE